MQPIKGFSKLSKAGKIEWITNQFFKDPEAAYELLSHYWHSDEQVQKLHDEFIENTVTNFYMPYGVSPNFLLNDRLYTIPMVIEESSVVAAASKSAAFWLGRGGFKAHVVSTKKIGQVHFIWHGDAEKLHAYMPELRALLLAGTEEITANMRKRGGGIVDIQLVNKTDQEPGYYQLHATFETRDAMGANFINSNLEEFARILRRSLEQDARFTPEEQEVTIVMCILSNYTPECLVHCEVSCPVDQLADGDDYTNEEFVEKFTRAIRIANIEPYRATTHNKGIMNGIDSVVLATGNDFRAVEACAHTYAARDGQYRSLTNVEVKDGIFRFWIEVPLALGTVGGLTTLHPMVKFSHELLGQPNAEELMMITAAVGLAQNFAAVKSLVTTGIQKGHMKMHLLNILNQLEAGEMEKERAKTYFSDKVVSFQAVAEFLKKLRGEPAVQILPGKKQG
ncbi:MAG: hydroxymethylglutaryl-CoA reductase [Sphingobacteriaceae bacterium]|nr:hydroxymethylglutaryl-CoA reductase [Sphingobacteriaceae bacterium]